MGQIVWWHKWKPTQPPSKGKELPPGIDKLDTIKVRRRDGEEMTRMAWEIHWARIPMYPMHEIVAYGVIK